jgi:hypothetical protein
MYFRTSRLITLIAVYLGPVCWHWLRYFQYVWTFRDIMTSKKKKLHGPSPRANYTDRATVACRRSGCQLLRIDVVTWSAWRILQIDWRSAIIDDSVSMRKVKRVKLTVSQATNAHGVELKPWLLWHYYHHNNNNNNNNNNKWIPIHEESSWLRKHILLLLYVKNYEWWMKLVNYDRLCGLVVRVLGYRSGGPGSIPGTT